MHRSSSHGKEQLVFPLYVKLLSGDYESTIKVIITLSVCRVIFVSTLPTGLANLST